MLIVCVLYKSLCLTMYSITKHLATPRYTSLHLEFNRFHALVDFWTGCYGNIYEGSRRWPGISRDVVFRIEFLVSKTYLGGKKNESMMLHVRNFQHAPRRHISTFGRFCPKIVFCIKLSEIMFWVKGRAEPCGLIRSGVRRVGERGPSARVENAE